MYVAPPNIGGTGARKPAENAAHRKNSHLWMETIYKPCNSLSLLYMQNIVNIRKSVRPVRLTQRGWDGAGKKRQYRFHPGFIFGPA